LPMTLAYLLPAFRRRSLILDFYISPMSVVSVGHSVTAVVNGIQEHQVFNISPADDLPYLLKLYI
jgi:hypothetical protein